MLESQSLAVHMDALPLQSMQQPQACKAGGQILVASLPEGALEISLGMRQKGVLLLVERN